MLSETVKRHAVDYHLLDLLNPANVFDQGTRMRELTTQDTPAFSAKLLAEFDRRRNIKDMFSRRTSARDPLTDSNNNPSQGTQSDGLRDLDDRITPLAGNETQNSVTHTINEEPSAVERRDAQSSYKRSGKRAPPESASMRPPKVNKSSSTKTATLAASKGQQSLIGFFKPGSSPRSKEDTSGNVTNNFHPYPALDAGNASTFVPEYCILVERDIC